MSEGTFGAVTVRRQTMALPGSSCDLRMGHGALRSMGKDLGALVGKPRAAAALVGEGVDAELLAEVRRQLADGGFAATVVEVPARGARTLGAAADVLAAIDAAGVTADDALLAVGDADVLGLASFVAGTWCGGTPLAVLPTDAQALLEGIASPRELDVPGGRSRMVSSGARPRMAFFDLDLPGLAEGPRFDAALALCVATAVCDGNNTFAALAADADAIAAGDVDVFATHLLELVRCRCKLASATSVAMRQGLSYGLVLSRALDELVEGCPEAVLVAEDLRFSSRLSVGCGQAKVDLVYGQDGLLERLGLGEVACDVSPDELVRAIKGSCLARSNRFLFPLPLAMGRVRLSSVTDEVLSENVAAWCDSRAELLADLDSDETDDSDDTDDTDDSDGSGADVPAGADGE